jgi:hypothetical protein
MTSHLQPARRGRWRDAPIEVSPSTADSREWTRKSRPVPSLFRQNLEDSGR